MMFSSQFDSSVGGFSMSQSQSESPAKKSDTPGLIPVTVKQISEASESGGEKANFLINGVDATNVTLVGYLTKKAERVTDVSFSIDDGTGQIDCKRWVNDTFDTKEMEEIQDDMYVRVIGHLKNFQGMKQLAIFSVRPVTNFDEITFHFIDCIHVHLQNSKLPSKLLGGSLTQSQTTDTSLSTPVRNAPTGYNVTSTNQFSVEGLKNTDQLVLDLLQESSNSEIEKGLHRDEISQHLKLPVDKIMESIRSLEEEGMVYSTIDEFHYKSTAC